MQTAPASDSPTVAPALLSGLCLESTGQSFLLVRGADLYREGRHRILWESVVLPELVFSSGQPQFQPR